MTVSVMKKIAWGIAWICLLVFPAFAGPFSSGVSRSLSWHHESSPSITRVHGFHCRPEVGWDARVGYYRRHSHPGICKDYEGCLKQQQRCIFINGRGWDVWKYERWGYDNWRYTNCMIKAGCY